MTVKDEWGTNGFAVPVAPFVVVGQGQGWARKPISLLSAACNTSAQNLPLLVNKAAPTSVTRGSQALVIPSFNHHIQQGTHLFKAKTYS